MFVDLAEQVFDLPEKAALELLSDDQTGDLLRVLRQPPLNALLFFGRMDESGDKDAGIQEDRLVTFGLHRLPRGGRWACVGRTPPSPGARAPPWAGAGPLCPS